MDKKTPLGLTLFAQRCRAEKVLYWYACQYQVRSQALLDRRAASHATWYDATVPWGGETNYNWCKTTISDTGRTCDCVGLPLGYAWWALDENPITYNYGANGAKDYSANQEYQYAKEKGDISTIPEYIGLGLWQEGHCGVYIGNGYTIESSYGTDYETGEKVRGVFLGKLGEGTKWTNWFKYPWLTYISEDDWIIKNEPLSEDEMNNNGYVFASYMMARGFTLAAVCGMLGNIQAESRVNPGAWQGYVTPFPADASKVGYGLTQWTPYTKFTEWAGDDYNKGNKQCDRIVYERDNGLQFYPTTTYNITFKEFAQSTKTPEYLAAAFLYNYERPAVYNTSVRAENARKWYNYLNAYPSPITPDRKKLPVWLLFQFGGRL